MKEKCLYKIISESESIEGESFRKGFEERHPNFTFRRCMLRCQGFNLNCEDYQNMEDYRRIQDAPL